VPGGCTRSFPSTAPVCSELQCIDPVSHREQRNVHQRSRRWSLEEGGGEASPPSLPPASYRAIPGVWCSYPRNSVTYIVKNEHFESVSLPILSCWLSIAVIADPHPIRANAEMQRAGRVLGGEHLHPRCSRPHQSGHIVKRHRKLGSVVESWEMAPKPRAPKPQFPRDAAAAEG